MTRDEYKAIRSTKRTINDARLDLTRGYARARAFNRITFLIIASVILIVVVASFMGQ